MNRQRYCKECDNYNDDESTFDPQILKGHFGIVFTGRVTLLNVI